MTAAIERPGTVSVWVTATRPRTLVASLVPVGIGTAVAVAQGRPEWSVAALCAVAALLLQLSTNLANDAFDFLGGVDDEGRLGPLRVTQVGWLPARVVLGAAATCSALAAVVGVALTLRGGWPILVIGLTSLLAAWAYSAGPFPLSRVGLGEVAAFLFFGIVAVMGTTYLQTGDWSALALGASLPVGLLAALLMGVNNLRDIVGDERAGKRTLAVRTGSASWRRVLFVGLGFVYVVPVFTAVTLASTGPLLPWLSLPLALDWQRSLATRQGAELNEVLTRTAKLLTAFGLLWGIGLCL